LNPFLDILVDLASDGIEIRFLLDPHGFSPDQLWNGTMNLSSNQGNLQVIRYLNEVSREEPMEGKLEARLAYENGYDHFHGNMILIDDHSVIISSFNWELDRLSEDRQVGIAVESEALNGFFKKVFDNDWTHSPRLFYEVEQPQDLIITEVFYDTYLSGEPDEYVAIHNPSDQVVDASGWFISDSEGTLWLPNNIFLEPGETIHITRSAVGFHSTFGFWPDLEYGLDSDPDVYDLKVIGGLFKLSNSGDEVILMDPRGNIVDIVIYGNSEYIGNGWVGKLVLDVSEGRILKRITHERYDFYFDTDSASDWDSLREYYPRQSEFPLKRFQLEGGGPENILTTFVSPDSSYEAIYSVLSEAQRSVYLNVYQLEHDRLVDQLVELSENGLDIRVLVEGDPVGGLTPGARKVLYQLQQAGCLVTMIINDPVNGIHDRYNYNHAKYAVIDTSVVIVMSENWKHTGVPVQNSFGNRGTGMIIYDPEIASYFTNLFLEDSNQDNVDIIEFDAEHQRYGVDLGGRRIIKKKIDEMFDVSNTFGDYLPRFPARNFNDEVCITPIISPEHSLLEHGSILEMIRNADQEILVEQLQCYQYWITGKEKHPNAYLEALFDAARRGCEVKILLDSAYIGLSESENDNDRVMQYINSVATREGLEEKLEARLIYMEDVDGKNKLEKLHNKGIIVDGRAVYVGSMNWGQGGPIKNREVGVIVEHEGAARYFREVFYLDWNLTLNSYVDVNVPFSSDLFFSEGTNAVTTELEIYNKDQNQVLELELSSQVLNHHHKVDLEFDRTTISIEPGRIESIGVTIRCTKYNDSIMDTSALVIGHCSNMTSTLFVFQVHYHGHMEYQDDSNGTIIPDKEPWVLRDIDEKWVLLFIVLTMVTISLLRDVVISRLKK
jgi:phosphatidylserine/phosphatidylglycerophosphate/cardiolipin synthase-like enzyme